MNIIQLQDRLKGLPEDALVNYVKNPMGEVPIYLALGEMQRRKDMKERFQASQADKPSVAEQLVAESEPMQMGLGAMAPQQMMPGGQGVGTPPSAPQMDPRQLAASGIAANPVSNVGQYAEGGIVGYGKGDLVKKKAKSLYDKLFGKGKDAVEAVKGQKEITSPQGVQFVKGVTGVEAADAVQKGFVRRRPYLSAGLGYGGYEGYNALFSGDDGDTKPKLTEEEIENILNSEEESSAAPVAPKLTEKQILGKRYKELEEIIGPDEGREKITDKLAKKEKDSLNMALINAGLGMAAGQSANFLDNLVAGAGAGLESYTNTEADIFEIETELAKADRSERMAIIGQALEDGRIDKKMANALAIANIQGPTVAKNTARIDKKLNNVEDRITQYEIAQQKNPTKENEAMLKILQGQRTRIINEANAGYGSSTSSSNMDLSKFNVVR